MVIMYHLNQIVFRNTTYHIGSTITFLLFYPSVNENRKSSRFYLTLGNISELILKSLGEHWYYYYIGTTMLKTAYNAYSSTDVDVLKFQLVQYNQFYDGKNQQDSSECLLMLIEIINKGSVPYYGSHVSNSTGVSLSDILFSFMLEKYIVCNVCGLRSPSIESSGVLYISPTHTSSMQELIMQGLQQKLEKSCFRCNKNTWHVESNHILQPPNYLIIVVNRFRYINNQFAKDKCSIPMDMTVVLGYHKFSLQATIDHHGPSIYSGHYTTSVNCCNRTFYCNDNKITEFDMINTKNSSTAYVVIYKLIT